MTDRTWRIGAVVAGVVTVACAAFAVGAAVSSDDDADGTSTGTGAASADGEPVGIVNFAFDPAELTVPAGSTVTWTNSDPDTHSIQTDSGLVSSPDLDEGGTFSFTFEEAGVVDYYCGIHDFMLGTVTVTS
jgi:plastocyanin